MSETNKPKTSLSNLEKLPNDENKEINLKTTKVTTTDKLFFESNNDIGKKQSFWRRNRRICISSIVLFVLIVIIVRVPFVGSYVDAFVFDYLWGFTKYIIYLWGVCLCIIAMFKPAFIRTIIKPKLIVMQVLIVFSVSLIFSAVIHRVYEDLSSWAFDTVLSDYHSKHFLEYIKPASQYHYTFSTDTTWWMNTYYNDNGKILTFVCGGLVGEFFVGLGYIFIILFAFFLLVFCVLSIVTSRSQKAAAAMQKLFSKIFSNKRSKLKLDELGVEKNDVSAKSVSDDVVRQEAETGDSDTPPLRFLTDTSVDNYAINKTVSEEVKKGILELADKLGITVKYEKTTIMPLYTELAFKVPRQESINKIIQNKVQLSTLTKLKEFNIMIKGNILRIEYANKISSKVSIKSVLSTNDVAKNKGNLLLGVCPNEKPLFLNLYKQPSILIAGTKGSGASMLLSSMLATYEYLNEPTNKFVILAKNDNVVLDNFRSSPHTDFVAKVDYTTNNVADILKDFVDTINRRLDNYRAIEVENFDEYNAYCRKAKQLQESRKTLVFCDFNEVVANNYEYTSLIQKILLNGHRCGVYIIILTNFVNDEILQASIYQNINTKIVLKLNTEAESISLFDSYRGFQLFGNGDGYIYGKDPSEKIRFQSCYLNQNELSKIIEIINNFYKK